MALLPFDQAAYSEYMDDMNYSHGFYVTPSKDGSVQLAGVRPVAENYGGGKPERAAKFAVEEHNNKAGEKDFLKFIKIVNLNVRPTAGALYYITALVEDAAGETCRYQMKIWEKLKSGYQVQIFRQAPYSIKLSEKIAHKNCCIGITNLMPWMDENYLYYKSFLAAREILGVEKCHDEGHTNEAYIWFRNCAEMELIVNMYGGRKMPRSDTSYTFI